MAKRTKTYETRGHIHPRMRLDRHGRRRLGNWMVRYPIPKELQGRPGFGRLKVIERSLGTTDHREARSKAREIISEIERRITRAKAGGAPLAVELEAIATAELHRAYDLLSARLIHYQGRLPKLAEDVALDLSDSVMAAVNDNPLLGGVTTTAYAEFKLRAAGIEPTEDANAKLAEAILQAHAIAIERVRTGASLPTFESGSTTMTPKGSAFGGLSVSEMAKWYLAHPDCELSKPYRRSCTATYRLFADHVRDAPLASVGLEQADSFAIALGKLHRNYALFTGSESLRFTELLKRYPAAGNGVQRSTVNRHLASLGALWKFAEAHGKIDRGLPSPFKRRKLTKSERAAKSDDDARPIPVADLNKLFAGASDPTLKWCLAVGLFSGLRQSELANLTAAEIRKSDKGTWYFDLTGRKVAVDGPDSVKTENSRRCVPVHPTLIEAGFLKIIPTRGPVFSSLKARPDGGRGATLAYRFAELRNRQGVDSGFHGLRRSFYAACDAAGLPTATKDMLTGHKRAFGSDTYNRGGLGADQLAPAVAKIQFPGLKLPQPEKGKRT